MAQGEVPAIRAIRGAVQLDADEREHLLASTAELVTAVMEGNDLVPDDLVQVIFTATPDLTSEFPAVAARQLGLGSVPLLCAVEIDVPGAMPRVVRLMALAQTGRPREQVRHVYLRGASALRQDIAQ